MVMGGLHAEVVDVNGAFLCGQMEEKELVYMKVPERFEKIYPLDVVLLLQRVIYGLIQSASQFWKELRLAFASMSF